ncbi:uncharacterized protein LOC127856491 isoform X2 [Dreissena polymorpha]|nr:uncharacterized protein LOC127856491 isoform X2 [Dreissena polymorpha]
MSELQHVSATSLQPSFEVSHYLASSNIITTSLAVDVQSTFPLPVLVISEMTSLPTSTLASVSLQEQSGSAAEPSAGPFHMDQSTKYSDTASILESSHAQMSVFGGAELSSAQNAILTQPTSYSISSLTPPLKTYYSITDTDLNQIQASVDASNVTVTIAPSAAATKHFISQSHSFSFSLSATGTPSINMPLYPPLVPALVPTIGTPRICGASVGCCTHALGQLPSAIMFEESEQSGKVLAMMRGVYNMTMTVTIVGSPQLPGLLQGVFNFTTSGSTVALVLAKHVDLEALYKRAGEDPSVTHFQIKIDCTDATMIVVPPRLVNVTIADVDDSMPVFLHQETAADTDCVVPVYSAGTSEDYMGELSLSPGNIEAVDGDLTSQHNISYSVIHSEPEDYHVYFDVNVDTGKVNKTRKMNASSPNKYVLFVKAKEDSPQQRSRVAVLSIVVMSPVDPFSASDSAVNPTVKFGLQIASAAVLLAFLAGFVVIIHHRYRQRHTKIHTENSRTGNSHKIQFAVYESSNSSLNTTIPDNPASPSQVTLDKDYLSVPPWGYVGSGLSESNMSSISSERTSDASTRRGSVYSTQSQNKRTLIVTKPLDPKLRPGWNAPPPRPKRTLYNPLAIWNQSKPNGDKSGKIK